MASALDGVVVLELARGIREAYCGKLLADLGARVIKVEPPGGDAVRAMGPFPGGQPDSEKSGLFIHLNGNKESLTADLTQEADRQLVRDLARKADILIEGFAPGYLASVGLGYDRLGAINPRLVYTSITSFGQDGPCANWLGEEIVDWAMGGYMYFTGHPQREPLMVPGHQAEFHGGMHGALAALAAMYYQRDSGRGQHVDVCNIEALLTAHCWLDVSWSHAGQVMVRNPSDLDRCADGYVFYFPLVQLPQIFILIEKPELASDPRYTGDFQSWGLVVPEVKEQFREWALNHTKEEIYHPGQELRLPITPVLTTKDLAESPQMAARQWWLTADQPGLGEIRLPGFPYRLTATPPSRRTPAPRLGEHNEAIRHEAAEAAAAAAARPRPAFLAHGTQDGRATALEGLLVVEMTANWAGPVCGRNLADLGAQVVKVELASKPATRGGYWPNMDLSAHPWNRGGYFNGMNRNKQDVVLDVGHALGRDAFLRLIREADVFIENNSARVMHNLNLDWEVLKEVNPRLIMVSMSGFGQSGPWTNYSAYGSNIEASCGLASLTGYRDGELFRTGFYYGDPVSGDHGTVALLAALEHRRRTGEGQFIDMSLDECAAGFFAEALLDYTINGVVREPLGSRSAVHAPQNAYRCAGNDNWIALCVRDDGEWAALARVIGRGEWAEDASLAGAAARQAQHDAIDAAVSAWTSTQDQYTAARTLQAAGVPAAPILANWQLLSDPHLYHRKFYVPVEHPEVGVYPYASWPWKLSRTPARVTAHAPLFAEHNRAVLGDRLGFSEEEIQRMYEEKVTADLPVGIGVG
jgi:crotonobetainyl-CoA:carnitine CoA-transferase CaiB-like acyl-CoA transferase